jgi:hypothetical protein
LLPQSASIVRAIARDGWTVPVLALHLSTHGVPFAPQSIAKAIDRIIDSALRDELARGKSPSSAARKILGINLSIAGDAVKANVTRRITRLTHTPPSAKHRGTNNA